MEKYDWGTWNFSPEVKAKIESLNSSDPSENNNGGADVKAWCWLVNLANESRNLKKCEENNFVTEVECTPVEDNFVEESMDISLQSDCKAVINTAQEKENADSRKVDDSAVLLLNALESPEPDVDNIQSVIKELSESQLITVIQEVWPQLSVASTRLRLCEHLVNNNKSSILCQYILLPWLSEEKCDCIEAISKLLPHCAYVACRTLVLPLLATEDSPFVSDIYMFKDLTEHLQADHWCLILSEFIQSIDNSLKKWHLPIIVVAVENLREARSDLLEDVLNILSVLMTCHVKDFTKDRDFGNIMIAVINCLSIESSTFLVKQMSDLTQLYAGPLRYKALNLLKSLQSRQCM